MTKSVDPAVGQRPAQRVPGRIKALDGLRGGGAVVVMVFHYLCLLHPEWVPGMVDAPVALADTPLFILWNGPFAVSVFFVLSGFVMAGAAERYHDTLVANAVTRYLRLAVPVLASVLLAWALLTAMPDAVLSLAATMETPSPWLVYTYQGEIPSLAAAVFDGLVANFVRGASDFNNVLWVMQIELVGSLGLFGVYWLFAGRARLFALGAGGLAIIAFLPAAYLAFVLGAFLYEAHVRGLLRPERMPLPLLALVAGIVLGGPGPGSAERWGLPDLPDRLTIGVPHGFIPVLAATLIHYGVLGLPWVARALSARPLQCCGRVSFALYLVHVPLLYTLVATARVHLDLPVPVLAAGYVLLSFGLAHLLTVAVDEPNLRLLKRLRPRLHILEPWGAISRAR